ncbi:MAG: hypothetical protein ABI639_01920 [Thermoanaerobaculia bacterium]
MNRMRIQSFLAAAGLALVTSATVYADAATTFYGTTSGKPFFTRPTSTGTNSGVVTRYQVQPFELNASASCYIEGIQEGSYDGMIFLYHGAFNPANPLVNLIAADDDAEFGTGSSRIDAIALVGGNDYFLVTAGYSAGGAGTFSNQVACNNPTTRVLVGYGQFGDDNTSDYDGRRVQLLKGRFEVSVTGENFSHVPFVGRTVPLASDDSAIFWFFQPANFELLIKLIDGCSLNNRFWVYYAATTNVAFRIEVYDWVTGTTKVYNNSLGSTSNIAKTDSDAFNTCL